MIRLAKLVLLVLLCAVLTSCGPSGVPVEGKVVNGANPYTLPEGETISISLQGDGGASAAGNVEKDGHFVVKSSTGKEVKPGAYKVSIVHYAMQVAKPSKDKPPGTKEKSALQPVTKTAGETWDINSANKSFTLDISKYK